jgi:hypothetical protein
MIDQQYLNEYYSTHWNRNPCSLNIKSGLRLLNKIKDNESVIDVGCGRNFFKGKIKNLIGIDPAFDEADVKCTILEYTTNEKFDVALCLGSLNYGDVNDVESNIEKVVSLLGTTARIYWRCNPGVADHEHDGCKQIPFYQWSIAEHKRLSSKFGFSLIECEFEGPRIYAEWTR